MRNLVILLLILIPVSVFSQGTWELVYDDLYGTLGDIFFVDEWEGWTVDWSYSTTGRIYHTIDGGFSWEIQDDPSSAGMFSVFFLNDSVGWAGGEWGVILKTTDGGETWEEYNIGINNTIIDIFFIDENEGWCVGGNNYGGTLPDPYFICHSEDGGEIWATQLYQTMSNGSYLESVRFANPDTGITGGIMDSIYITMNGGFDWNKIHMDSIIQMIGIDYLGNGIFYGVGYNVILSDNEPIIVLSRDFGITWQKSILDSVFEGFLLDIDFADSLKGICVGLNYTDGCSFTTSDGGETWQYLSPNCTNMLIDVSYPKPYCAWSFKGTAGDVFRYTDSDISPPSQINDLTISPFNNNIRLLWLSVTQDIFGHNISVEGYDIYRAPFPQFNPLEQWLLGTTTDTTYIDFTVNINQDSTFFYKIISQNHP